MFIVHGTEKANQLKDKYTVLELDTIPAVNNGEDVTLYTVIDTGKLSLDSMSTLAQFVDLHEHLIENLHKEEFDYCKQVIDQLKGSFGGQVDSFYDHVLARLDT